MVCICMNIQKFRSIYTQSECLISAFIWMHEDCWKGGELIDGLIDWLIDRLIHSHIWLCCFPPTGNREGIATCHHLKNLISTGEESPPTIVIAEQNFFKPFLSMCLSMGNPWLIVP